MREQKDSFWSFWKRWFRMNYLKDKKLEKKTKQLVDYNFLEHKPKKRVKREINYSTKIDVNSKILELIERNEVRIKWVKK